MTPRPLSTFLARLIWLCMAPLLLLAVWLAWDNLREQEARHLNEGAGVAQNFVVAIDQHLQARINALHMLAVSPLVDDSRRWPELYAEAQGFRESFGLHVIFADSDRQMLFNTRLPYGARLPRLPDSKGKTAAPLALETSRAQVGDIVISPIDKKTPLVAIAVPVLREGRPTRLMLSTFGAAYFKERIAGLAMPADWSIALQDGTGADIVRRSPPGFDAARDVNPDHRFVVRSALSPWSVVVEIPRDSHQAIQNRSLLALVAAIILATLLGLFGGTLAGRRLGRQVAALADAAGANAAPSGIAEIAAARRTLDAAEAGRVASQTRFACLFQEVPVSLCFMNKDGVLADRNRRFDQTFGYGHDELRTLDDWWPLAYPDPDYRTWVRTTWDTAVADAAAHGTDIEPIEYTVTCKDGRERVMLISGIALGEDFLATFFDVTARKQAEQALAAQLERQQQARLAALNQMEDANAARREVLELNAGLERRVEQRTAELSAANQELESFAYAVSHDLRAPLRAMSGFSQALVEDYGDRLQGEAKLFLDQIGIASRRMTELIDGILTLSRSTRGELRRDHVDLSELAGRRLGELERIEPQRQVAVAVEEGLTAWGDARMLEAVMTNLLDNAWKYTGKAAGPAIRVFAEQRDGKCWFCVADNGAGFDMAHAARLFQPFQRLHRQDEFPGIGIGLATVQRIIHRHGGEIVATATPGQGATFCFTLPGNDKETTL